jgi:hypothetical protein
MPQHEIHYNIDDIFIGTKFPHVHQTMDILSGEGPNHRRMFHDDGAVADILAATGRYEDAWSARYHLIADRIVRDGANPQDLPENVRKESIIAELMDLIARGDVELVVFPDSMISRLVSSIVNGSVTIVDPTNFPPLKKQYYIKR